MGLERRERELEGGGEREGKESWREGERQKGRRARGRGREETIEKKVER